MSLYIYIILVCINLFMIITKKKNKVIAVLSVVFLFLLIQGNVYNDDYNGYLWYYNNQQYPDSWELGYRWISAFMHDLGASYNTFLLVLYVTTFLVAIYVVRRFTNNYHLAILLFLSFSAFFATIQVRAFVVEMLYLLMLLYLSKKNRIAFLVILALMVSFHKTSILYLAFLFINPDRLASKKFVRISVALIAMLCVVVLVNGNRIPFINVIVEVIFGIEDNKMTYFMTNMRFGFLASFLRQLVVIYISYISNRFIQRHPAMVSEEQKKFSETIYLATMLSCFALPLVMMNSNFVRYFRINLLPVFLQVTMVVDVLILSGKIGKADGDKWVSLGKRYCVNYGTYILLVFIMLAVWVGFSMNGTIFEDIMQNNMYFTH